MVFPPRLHSQFEFSSKIPLTLIATPVSSLLHYLADILGGVTSSSPSQRSAPKSLYSRLQSTSCLMLIHVKRVITGMSCQSIRNCLTVLLSHSIDDKYFMCHHLVRGTKASSALSVRTCSCLAGCAIHTYMVHTPWKRVTLVRR